jgi:hypothetical protein
MIGHAGRLLPVFATFVCLAAAGYGLAVNGRADGVGDRVSALINHWRASGLSSAPAGPIPASPNSGSGASRLPQNGAASTRPSGGAVGKDTIFDLTVAGSPENPVSGTHYPASSSGFQNPSNAPTPNPTSLAPLRVRYADAQASVLAARAKLDAMQEALELKLANAPDYRATQSDLATAEAELADVRAHNDPGSVALIAASRKVLDARTAFQKVMNSASAGDPAVTSARRELADAQHALALAKAQQDDAVVGTSKKQ